MSSLDSLIQDLVIANRILAKEEVVDAYGHVSVRHPDHPDRFFIARSVAPDLVGPEDIVELGLDGQPVGGESRQLYLERFIHAAIFEARPDVMAVVHAHAEDTLPFGIASQTKLRPVIHDVMRAFWLRPTRAEARAWGGYVYDSDPTGTADTPTECP